MPKLNPRTILLSTTILMTSLPVTALAQVDEIVTTATRRTEPVQDVPISVTAIAGDDLADLRALATKDIGNQVPNVNLVQGNFGFGAPIISIRGVTNGDFSAVSNTPVAVYADDIVLTNILSHGFSLYDLERVELLRGPQGTLFGRNSTSGALQFISAKPTDEFSAGGSLSYATHNDLVLEGHVSGPLSDKVKGRISGFHRNRDGVVENVLLNQDESSIDLWSFRGILDAELSDDFSITIKAQHSQSSGDGVIFHSSIGDNPFTFDPITFAPIVEAGGDTNEFDQVTLDLPNRPEDVQSTQISMRADWDLNENWTLTGILGRVDVDFEEFNDDDASGFRIVHEYVDREIEQTSAELRLVGQVGNLDLVTGAFLLNEKVNANALFEFTDDPFIGTAATNALFSSLFLPEPFSSTDRLVSSNKQNQELDAYALFAHGKLPLSDQFGISAGLRYSKDKKDITVFDGNVSSFISVDPFAYGADVQNNSAFTNFVDVFGILPFEPAGTVVAETDADAVTGELTLEYTPNENALLYASYRRGFKGSSFDATTTSTLAGTINTVPEESVNAYEVGVKTGWADNRVILNGSAFIYDYSDFQAFEFLSINGFLTNFLFSIPEVKVKGVELELYAQPTDRLEFNLGLGLLDTEITDANVQLSPGVVLTIAEGNEIRNAPKVNFNAGVSYEFSLGNFSLTPRADYFYVGKYYSDFINTKPDTQYGFDTDGDFIQDAFITAANGSRAGDYGQLNLALTLSTQDERYAFTVFGQNVTDELQVTGRFPGNFANGATDFATVNDGNRKVWGVRLNAKF